MMEQLTLIDKCNITTLYACGVMLSLFLRFIILTVSIYINQNTRLKEIKNTTKKLSKAAIKHSYLSFIWPIELAIFTYKNIKHLIVK
jgi:hypothetical protein